MRRLHEEMPLPGKVERPQRVTRLRRIKAESNAADLASFESAQDDKVVGLSCAVLKLDAEGDGAARRVKFLELSTCEERRQFFHFGKG